MTEQFRTSDFVKRTGWETIRPVENSDPFADKAPVDDVALIHETPASEIVASVGPIHEPLVDEIPMHENSCPGGPDGGDRCY